MLQASPVTATSLLLHAFLQHVDERLGGEEVHHPFASPRVYYGHPPEVVLLQESLESLEAHAHQFEVLCGGALLETPGLPGSAKDEEDLILAPVGGNEPRLVLKYPTDDPRCPALHDQCQ